MRRLLLAAALASTTAAAAPDPRIATVERGLLPAVVTERTRPMRLADRMRHYRVPGLSVAVIDDGRLAWSAAWGWSDAAARVPMSTTTLLQGASISKAVAALGAFRLVEQNRLSLDEPVADRLRRWTLPPLPGAAASTVTLRGLLSHDAGLTVHGFAGYAPGAPLPSLAQILDGQPPANSPAVRPDRPQGQGWRYSGGGYVLTQLLMEDITGEPFAAWMQAQLLRPAGLQRSFFGAAPAAASAIDVAVGHQGLEPLPERRRVYPELAAAGLWTTPLELAALTLQLQRALAGSDAPAASAASMREALRVQSRGQGVVMGLGFFLEGPQGEAGFGHNGSNQGFESVWRADGRRAVVMMANSNGAAELMAELGRAIAAAHGWRDLQVQPVPWRDLAARFEGQPLLLRGTMNAWGTDTAMRRVGPRRYTVEVALPAGRTEFKFATADWQQVNLGASFVPDERVLQVAGRNLLLDVDRAGRYRFELDARNPERPVHRVRRL